MNSALQISLVVPTFQRRDAVALLLRALTRQTLPPGQFEVIVVIDGSEDGTSELLADLQTPFAVRWLWQPNSGRAAACNAGIAAAWGRIVVLLDDDMEPEPQLLAAHLQAHEAAPRLCVLGAVPILPAPAASPTASYIAAKFARHLEKLARPDYQLSLRDFYSGNASLSTALLREVGGFDEAFRIYGNEDLELSLRLRRAGVQFVFSTEACARQHYLKRFAALASDTIAKGRTSVLLVQKHPEAFYELKLSAYGREGSPRWRLLRAGLLRLGDRWPATTRAIVRLGELLEGRRTPPPELFYMLALDYCYWHGACMALRERYGRGASWEQLALAERAAHA